LATSPRDPRYRVEWKLAAAGTITVDASENERFLNGLSFDVELSTLQGAAVRSSFTQTGPGRYEATIPPSTEPRLAKVLLAGNEIDRAPLAGRYPHEFDAIGLDQDALAALATRTGGRIISADQKTPIELPTRWERASLTPWLAALAAVFIAIGLIQWKRAGVLKPIAA